MLLQDCLTVPDLPTTTYAYTPGKSYQAGMNANVKIFGIGSTTFLQRTGKQRQVWSAWTGSKMPCHSKAYRCSEIAMSSPYI